MPKSRVLSDPEIVAMYLSGVDSLTVGLNAGCDAQTVLNIVRAAGHQTRRPGGVKRRKHTDMPIEEAARLYESGMPVQAVADKAGLDRETMKERLREFGVRIRSLSEVATMKKLAGRKLGRPAKP